jgi:hypothetical protein
VHSDESEFELTVDRLEGDRTLRCVETYVTMSPDAADARALLKVAPDQYVTERTRLIKEARAAGGKARASFYQALKRPSVALWAALASSDAAAVKNILDVTTELGEIQAGGSDPGSLSAATQRRRKTLEAFVRDAVKALARFDAGAEKRRPEIRALVDQLSRHPELSKAWIDGTLRELPDSEFGFGAFADVDLSAPTRAAAPAPAKKRPRPGRRADPAPKEPTRDLAAERRARAERTEQARQAKKAVAAAAREVEAAQRTVAAARSVVKQAEKQLRRAEDQQTAAERRHERAQANHESLR